MTQTKQPPENPGRYKAGIEEGRYDREDMPIVLHCAKKWIREGS